MHPSFRDGSGSGGASRLQLASTLEMVFSEAVYDHSALQEAVCHYVGDLKKSGMSAQQVVIATNDLVREAASAFPPSDRMETLLTRMLGWCLDEYYRESA